VESLAGSADAKRRVKLILATLAGERTIAEVCRELGVGETRFHELRQEILSAALAAAEPKPCGRPPSPEPTPLEEELAQLREQNKRLRFEAEAAIIREELALVMPQVLCPKLKSKKKNPNFPASPNSSSVPAANDTKPSLPSGAEKKS
jgi:transposase-like protein